MRGMCLALLLGFAVCSCVQATVLPTTAIQPTGYLTPYHTGTPPVASPTTSYNLVIPTTPAPTATPFIHTVKKDETMLGIAFQYGVSLDDLKAANPSVDPRMMSVGLQLVIPLAGEIPETMPTATPLAVTWDQPVCYITGEEGAWCILTIINNLDSSVENLSVHIGMYTSDGEIFSSQVAYAPLNLLQPGDTMPLFSYFPSPLPENFRAHAELISGIPVAENDERYLDHEVNINEVEISSDGKQAMVRGEVVLPNDTSTPSQLWVLIVAYDGNGDIVGARKWESSGDTRFEMNIFSLSGMIDHIDAISEARP